MSEYRDENLAILLLLFLQSLDIAYDDCSDLIDSLEDQIAYSEKMWSDLMSDRFR